MNNSLTMTFKEKDREITLIQMDGGYMPNFYLACVAMAKAVGYTEATIKEWFPEEERALLETK